MNDDERCCGSGTCIINAEGRCWCGQQWNGEKMVGGSIPQCQSPDLAGTVPKQGTDELCE